MNKFSRQRGMTLVELMVATSIGLTTMTIGLRFVIQTLKTYQYETGKLLINRDIRKFTGQMIDDATYANSFKIYDQISNLSRGTGYMLASGGSADPTSANYLGYSTDLAVTAPANPVDVNFPGTEDLDSGLAGDVLVFVYNTNGVNTIINQLIIYYRPITTTPGGTTGTNSATVSDRITTLRRLVVTIPSSAQTAGLMKLLPYIQASTNGRVIFDYVDGQANDEVPTGTTNRSNKMFYNLNTTSILVRGRIYENYTGQRIVKSTYNFTVTPRG